MLLHQPLCWLSLTRPGCHPARNHMAVISIPEILWEVRYSFSTWQVGWRWFHQWKNNIASDVDLLQIRTHPTHVDLSQSHFETTSQSTLTIQAFSRFVPEGSRSAAVTPAKLVPGREVFQWKHRNHLAATPCNPGYNVWITGVQISWLQPTILIQVTNLPISSSNDVITAYFTGECRQRGATNDQWN